MKRLFAGNVGVHYSAMYFQGAVAEMPDGDAYFEGQVNGLCGARMRTLLLLRTGLHTGSVSLTVEFWDKEPPLEDSWEEAVEVSFVVNDPEWTGILEWGGAGWYPIDLRWGRYRVRYCARNMDAGRRKDTLSSDTEDPIDDYSLSFWFAPAGAPDRVLRQTSQTAANWHQWANRISRECDSAEALVLESLLREMETSTEIFEGLAKNLHVINLFIRYRNKTIWRLQQEPTPQVVVLTYVFEFMHSWFAPTIQHGVCGAFRCIVAAPPWRRSTRFAVLCGETRRYVRRPDRLIAVANEREDVCSECDLVECEAPRSGRLSRFPVLKCTAIALV